MNNQNYQTVTDRIIAQLEAGARPWQKSWQDGDAVTLGAMQRPLRSNGKPYTGVNTIALWAAAQARGFTSRYWFTFKGAKEAGGSVRKGAKSELAFFVGQHTVTDTDAAGEETERSVNFLRAYCVFNADECEGLAPKYYGAAAPIAPVVGRDADADRFVAGTGAQISHGGSRAFYQPSTDAIRMPTFAQFDRPESYYATLLHELAHWTGADTRLARGLGLSKRFGDDHYAAEELVAELAAAFLCADLGISDARRPDHASYLASWLRVLKADNKAIFKAASMAEKAAAFLHGLQAGDSPDGPDGGESAPEPVAAPEPAPIAPEPVAPEPVAPEPVAPAPVAPEPVAAPAAPEPVAPEPVAAPAAPLPAAPCKAAKRAASVTGPEFWQRAVSALQAVRAAHGTGWRKAAPGMWVSLPPRLRAFKSAAGVPVRYLRDHHLPAAQYWPGGALPVGPSYRPYEPAFYTGPEPVTLCPIQAAPADGTTAHVLTFHWPAELDSWLAQQDQIAADRAAAAAKAAAKAAAEPAAPAPEPAPTATPLPTAAPRRLPRRPFYPFQPPAPAGIQPHV